MHSNNYLQKETTPTFQDNRNMMTIEHYKTVNVSRTNSFTNEKCFGIENCPNFDTSQSKGQQYGNGQSEAQNCSQIRYPSFQTTYPHQMGESIKNTVKTSFLSNLEQSNVKDITNTDKNADTNIREYADTNKKADTNIRQYAEHSSRFFKDPLKFHENRETNYLQASLKKSLTFLNCNKVPTLNSSLETPVNTELKPVIAKNNPIPFNTFPRPMDFSSRNEFLFTSTHRTLDTLGNSAESNKFLNTVCTNRISDIDKINYERYNAKTNRNLLETKGIENTVCTNRLDISKADYEKYKMVESNNAKFEKPIYMLQDESLFTTSNNNRNLLATDQFKHTLCTNKMDDTMSDYGKHKIVENNDMNLTNKYMYKIDKSEHLGTLAGSDVTRNSMFLPQNTVCINKIDKTDHKKDKREEKSNNLFQDTLALSTSSNPVESKYENTVCTNRMDKVYKTREFYHEKHKIAENYAYDINKSMNVFNNTGTQTTPDVNNNHTENIAYSDGVKNVYETRETVQTDKYINKKTMDFCTNATCDRKKCSNGQQTERPASSAKSTYCVSTRIKKEFPTCECENKCINTIDSALDILQSILREVKRCRDQNAVKNQFESTKHEHEHRKDGRDSWELKRDVSNPAEILRPECMKVLKEIKKHTETLEEHLFVMSKNMKIKRKAINKTDPASQSYCVRRHQKKDIITQNPEKKNMFVQEPCPDFQKVENKFHFQNMENNFDFQKMENNFDFQKNDLIPHREMDNKSEREKVIEERKNKKEIAVKLVKQKNSLKEIKNVQIQSLTSLKPATFDLLPIATSTPIKGSQSNSDYNVCCGSNHAQAVMSKENVRSPPVKRITSKELTNYCINKQNKAVNAVSEEEISDEAAIVILLVTKVLNSRCLKSKYKKSEFLNFKPRCVTDSCAAYDQKLVKCKSVSRRKIQIPIVFRVPSVRCKTDSESEEVDDEQLSNMKSVKCSCNTSDLGSTVCTQSSSSRITDATSASYINADANMARRKEGCILS